MPTLDSTDLQNVARERYGVAGVVRHVRATGGSDLSDGLSWGTAFATAAAAVAASSAGDLILVGPGSYVLGSQLTLPAGVNLKGFDRENTILASTIGSGNAFSPGNLTAIEGVTLYATSASHVFGWGGSASVSNAVLRNVRLLSGAGGDLVNVTSSVAGALTLENVLGRCVAGGNGILSTSAAHEYRITDSYLLLFGSGAVAGLNLSGAANARGYRVEISLPDATAGIAVKVANTSQSELFDSQLYAKGSPVNVVDNTAAVRLIGGQFDRTKLAGSTGQITDVADGAALAQFPLVSGLRGAVPWDYQANAAMQPMPIGTLLTIVGGTGAYNLTQSGGTGLAGAAITLNGVAVTTDQFLVEDAGSNPVGNAFVQIFAAADTLFSVPLATTITGADGRWIGPIRVNSGAYTLLVIGSGDIPQPIGTITVP